MNNKDKKQILLGLTGSVASKLGPKLAELLSQCGFEVVVVPTDKALYFFEEEEIAKIPNCRLVKEADEWPNKRYAKDQEIQHIEQRKLADLLLIAPLTANTLTKMAIGLCDNLLTTIFYAWDRKKPIIVAPAMNTVMWENFLTQKHLADLETRYHFHVISPVEKKLACGDMGKGAMAGLEDIVAKVKEILIVH